MNPIKCVLKLRTLIYRQKNGKRSIPAMEVGFVKQMDLD
jgi:hypothetical protein